jgi:hypothetical protein
VSAPLSAQGDRCAECGHLEGSELGRLPLLVLNGRLLCEDCYALEQLDEQIVTAEEFAAVDEPGAEPLLGTPGEALIAADTDTILYGKGGSSKTTISLDLACHLAAGEDWLGCEVPRPLRVLVIEAEGPRPMFRAKLRRKLAGWHTPTLGDRLRVVEEPWAEFRFDDASAVARWIGKREVEVLIVGPVTGVGFEESGTIPEVREFMEQVGAFRRRSGRKLATVLVHHENKAGTISGAFEGVCDTLLHATVHQRGQTTLEVEKARWASSWHRRTLKLAWIEGEGFEVVEEEERDLDAEIVDYLNAEGWRTAREIALKKEGGIGAKREAVEARLQARRDLFESRTGPAAREVDRHPNATVWGLAQSLEPDEPHGSIWRAPNGSGLSGSTRRESQTHGATPDALSGLDQTPEPDAKDTT